MNDLTNFEDFEEEKSTLVLDSTDELKVAGFAKEAYSKGKPTWWIEEKVKAEKPNLTWIIPKVLGVETTGINKYIVSKSLTTGETSSSTKKLLYGSLVSCLLLSTAIFLIDSHKRLTKVLKSPSTITNTESSNLKKETNSLNNEQETLK